MNLLKVISYNINGLNHPIKRKKILSQLKKLNCSIALLQETHLDDKEHRKLKREWVGQVFSSSCKEGRKRGVAILVHRALNFTVDKTHADKEGRHILIVGSIGGVKISILNLYAPNKDDTVFFKDISSTLTSFVEGTLLVGGDFNCILNQYLDKYPLDYGNISRKTRILRSLIEEMGLVDIWRQKHPKDRDYTFFPKYTIVTPE